MNLAELFPKYKCPKCDDWFHMPFKYCRCNEYTPKLTHQELNDLISERQMKLRDYQAEAIDQTAKAIGGGMAKPLIIAPTASGKSVIIAGIASRAVAKGRRVLVLCFQNEILEQNEACLNKVDPDITTGIYCASSGRKDTEAEVIFASRDSLVRNPEACGAFDFLVVDEAHLVSNKPKTSYGKIFAALEPKWVVGLTGTPYRLGSGTIFGGQGFFDGVSYNIGMRLLIERGYLCDYDLPYRDDEPIIDSSGVRVKSTGDFDERELEAVCSSDEVVERCVDEWQAQAAARKCSIFFCVTLNHAQAVAKKLESRGVKTAYLDGKTNKKERAKLLDDCRAGEYQAIVNVGVLTTGVDIPRIDCVVYLRPTKSAALFVQSGGRGLRVHADKKDCLFLDFAGNFDRFGSLEEPLMQQAREEFQAQKEKAGIEDDDQDEDQGLVNCSRCKALMPKSAGFCSFCGFVESIEVRHGFKPATKRRSGWFMLRHCEIYSTKTQKEEDCVVAVYYLVGVPKPLKEWLMFKREGWVGAYASKRINEITSGKVMAIFCEDRTAEFPRIKNVKVDKSKDPTRQVKPPGFTTFRVLNG